MEPESFALVNERLVADSYCLRRASHPPALKQPDPVLQPGQAYGTVLHQPDGFWRMYYLKSAYGNDRYEYREHLALSSDGIFWETPSLGLVEIDGSKNNNCVMAAHYRDRTRMDLTGATGPEGFCVRDAQQDCLPHARSRYTCMYLARPTDRLGGICLAHSEDGLIWAGYPENPLIPGWPDTQAVFFFDQRINKYVLYSRPTIHAGLAAHANRKIARAESDDLIHWSTQEIVLDTDERDAPALEPAEENTPKQPRGRSKQFYGITVFPYANLYLGLAWLYDVPKGAISVELVRSTDGIRWQREATREPFIADGVPAGLSANMVITPANAPIIVGDELWLYCSVTNRRHGEKCTTQTPRNIRIMLLALPRDRWVSYDAGEREGELLSQAFQWDGGRLFLNASIREGGQIIVRFCDELGQMLRGLGLDEPVPLHGPAEGLRLPIRSGPGPISVLKMPSRGPIRLHFTMRNASLFGWTLA